MVLSTDGQLDAGDTVLGTAGHTGALAPGASYAASTAVEHCAAWREYDSPNLVAYLDGPHQVLDTDS